MSKIYHNIFELIYIIINLNFLMINFNLITKKHHCPNYSCINQPIIHIPILMETMINESMFIILFIHNIFFFCWLYLLYLYLFFKPVSKLGQNTTKIEGTTLAKATIVKKIRIIITNTCSILIWIIVKYVPDKDLKSPASFTHF